MIIHWKDKTKTRFTSSYRMHFYTEFIHLWRARLFVFFHDNIAGLILIHAPVKGATEPGRASACPEMYFNTRTREGCDTGQRRQLYQPIPISIHAPVKGATQAPIWICLCITWYFNPRTREGCDRQIRVLYHLNIRNFNPRTREGCDTIASELHDGGQVHFNPRTREGCDKNKQ